MKEEVRIYDLSWSAFQEYKEQVKGNKYTSFEIAQKKLSRNIACGVKRKTLKSTLQLKQEFIYGELRIVVRLGEIIKIENHIKDPVKGWKKDYQKYIRISKALKIPYEPKKKHWVS
jgi:hypothetical protein